MHACKESSVTRAGCCESCDHVDHIFCWLNVIHVCMQGGFSYSGQRCTAVKVVLVLEKVADELVKKVNEGVNALTVGKPEVSTSLLHCCLQ